MKVELSPGHLYFSTQQEEDGEELSEVDACTVAQAKAEEKLSIVTKLILINDIPLEIIAKVSDLPMEELEKIKESDNFSKVYDLDLTIQLTFERLQDFYAVLATIPAENLVGVNIQSLSIAEFINRLLSDEEF